MFNAPYEFLLLLNMKLSYFGKKEKESIGNYKNDFPKGTVEMQGVKKLSDKETSVKLKFAGERLTFSFVTETPYEKVVEILK